MRSSFNSDKHHIGFRAGARHRRCGQWHADVYRTGIPIGWLNFRLRLLRKKTQE